MKREKSIEKRSRKWLSILGLAALGVFTLGCDDYDGPDNGDYDDYGGDDDNDFDEMLRDALKNEMPWGDSPKSKGPWKHSEREVKKIRRRAYIWKHKNVKVGHNSEDLRDENVKTAYTLLYNQAFKYINCVPEKTLGPKSKNKVGSVKLVEIGDCSRFRASDKFPYDTEVTIYYRTKLEFELPFSANSVRGRNYVEVCSELESLGFTNVIRKPKKYMIAGLRKTDGAIDRVYIEGEKQFSEGTSYSYDTEIIVEYHSYAFSK